MRLSLLPILSASLIASLFGTPATAQAPTAPADVAVASGNTGITGVDQGRYLAVLGDCIACHTAEGGDAMAGGRPLETPFGVVYSTNITPDPQTGIGSYSFTQFDRAMRQGVAADGHRLYPAMPYPSYAKISESDMRALYTYLTQGLAPVARPNKPAEMRWPFSMRWGLGLWNLAFADIRPFQADPGHDAVWNRGAYLVQGLGHCGSCHTPRGIGFQEKAMSDSGPSGNLYLAGETVENWRALSLRNLWTVEDTVAILKTGQNRFATVSGNMTEVIHNSTQHVADADLIAIATYLKALPPGAHDVPMPAVAPASKTALDLFTSRGGLGYVQFCVDCHRQDGGGLPGLFPPLAGNPAVSSGDPATLLHVALTGSRTAATAVHPRVVVMPGFAHLSDSELAEIFTFVRNAWGSGARPVAAPEVAKARTALNPKGGQSTAFVTPRLADMLSAPNADQLVRGMRLNLETRDLLPDFVGNKLNCTSCHLNVGTVADGSPFVGLSAKFPSYAPRAGKVITIEDRINGCFRRSMHGKPLPNDSADMKAMVAYFDWMKAETKPDGNIPGRGVGKVDMSIQPDPENGRKIYANQCAACHGAQGEGLRQADGGMVIPPLWGELSFNIGAGMARTYTAAAFVLNNMPIAFYGKFPLGQGGLSVQEAVDVAEYFTHQPRPDFPDKVKDWPKDKKPSDSRY